MQSQWPPKDPRYENHQFELPDTPWTYQKETFNPDLVPSNSARQQRSTSRRRRRPVTQATSVPPYHPDYGKEAEGEVVYEDYYSSSDEDQVNPAAGRTLFRRGSEGYEVRPVAREDMLNRYLNDLGDEPGRYNKYVPEPSPPQSDEGDDIPLGARGYKQA